MGEEALWNLVFSRFFVAACVFMGMSYASYGRMWVRTCTVRMRGDILRVYSGHEFLGRSG